MSAPGTALIREPEQTPAQRLAEWIASNSTPLAIGVCICFAALALTIAARRPFWFDEILTISVARAPTIKDVLADFRLGYDQTPPLNTLLVRLSCSLFGWSEIAARLPSAICATAGLFLIFHRVKTLANGLSGLVAISALMVTCLPMYAYEARPYALLFFASVLSIWFWTSGRSESPRSSTAMSLLFGLALALGVLAHYYGVLLIVPFILVESSVRGLRRLISFRLACWIVGTAAGLLLQLPFIRGAAQPRPTPFWAPPSLQGLQHVYVDGLIQFIFVLVCVVLLAAWERSHNASVIASQTAHERLGWFFLAIPIAGFILAELITHAFTERYFISFLAGFGVALGLCIYRYGCHRQHVPLLLVVISLLLFFQTGLSRIRYARTHAVSGRTEEADFADEMLPRFRAEGKAFVLLPTHVSYLEASYYSPRRDMIYFFFPANGARWFLRRIPNKVRFFSIDGLRQHARDTAFVAPSSEVLSDLEKLGFRLHFEMTKSITTVYAE